MPPIRRRRPLSRTGRMGVAAAAVVMLALVAMAAARLQGVPRFDPPAFPTAAPPERPAPTKIAPSPEVVPERRPPTPHANELLGRILEVLVLAVAAAILVALVVVLARALRARQRRLRVRSGTEVADGTLAGGEASDEVQAAAILRGIAGARTHLARPGIPADAIVAAWVGLEESAADAGVSRGPAETPREFTVRVIASRPGAEADVRTLLGLYERVRFGGHAAGDDDRARALESLGRLEEVWR